MYFCLKTKKKVQKTANLVCFRDNQRKFQRDRTKTWWHQNGYDCFCKLIFRVFFEKWRLLYKYSKDPNKGLSWESVLRSRLAPTRSDSQKSAYKVFLDFKVTLFWLISIFLYPNILKSRTRFSIAATVLRTTVDFFCRNCCRNCCRNNCKNCFA